MEASLCLEAAERPQWPRVYSLDRPRSRGCMPNLVGDSGQVLGVQAGLDWNAQVFFPLGVQLCLKKRKKEKIPQTGYCIHHLSFSNNSK